MNEILKKIGNIGIVPVVKIEDAKKAPLLADALIKGGLPCAEITFRTSGAADAISAIVKSTPNMLVGAGTVINTDLAKRAKDAGAKFIVSPGFNPDVVDWCIANDMPIVPGVNNPSGVEAGLARGLSVLKFFPAEASGGVAMLSALAGPFPQVTFMPTGGIGMKNLSDYAKCKNVHAIGGSWMVKADLIESGNWQEITRLCKDAVYALHGFSLAHIGINEKDDPGAVNAAAMFEQAFGFTANNGKPSVFNGSIIEIMKGNGRGTHGHIGFTCYNIERALSYLETLGFKPVEETAKRENGALSIVYLDKEIAGFAIHLVRAK